MLDDDLLAAAMKLSSAHSKRAVVQEALATYVSVKARQQQTESYRDRLAGIRKRLAQAPIKTSSRSLIRADRDRKA